jgi:tetratricopeptide (TPR) repeat protein
VDRHAPERIPPPPDTLPAQVGRYRIEGEIARGGMGVVLHAHDVLFDRPLAIKVLLGDAEDQAKLARRFLEEAHLMGQLQHPGVPPVYDRGTLADGRPFFAMKLIQGRTLAELLQKRGSPAEDLLRFLAIFEQVCQTVAYAHSRGIIHRDLKPANIMVGAFGEVQVMDWGLAKRLASKAGSTPVATSGLACELAVSSQARPLVATVGDASAGDRTQAGTILGTPGYLAPEQARGEVEHLDERCDVFGLGSILCVLLTGLPPFTEPSPLDLLVQTAAGELTDAYHRLDACGADEELTTLAKRCLAPLVEERPRDAGEVAAAVAAYQAQVQERLKQAAVDRARAGEERKRRKVTLALAVAVLLLLSGAGATGWWYQQQEAERALGQAEREAANARQALRQERAADEVKAALREAAQLREHALALLDNPESWQATLTAALSAVKRAEALLAQEPELAEQGRMQQVAQLRDRLEADRKDWQLLAVYDQIRLEQSQLDSQQRQFKLAEFYPRLKQALADYGLAIGALKADEAAARLRQRPLAVQPYLRAVLWECLGWAPKDEVGQRQWLEEVLAVEADPWLKQFRQAVAQRTWKEVEKLAGQAEMSHYHPAVLLGLAHNLPDKARASAVLLLRRTQQQYPGDFWVNLELGDALYRSVFGRGGVDRPARAEELPIVNEAVAFWRVAVGLRPNNASAHNNLGGALAAQGDVKGAIACYTKALDLDPTLALAHYNLGLALYKQGDVKRAIECYTKALALDPKDAKAHHNLGYALAEQGDLKRAVACYHQALTLDPKYATAHNNLGIALYAQGDLKRAVACYHQALTLDPKYAHAHNNLGLALKAQGDLKGAMACYHKALALDPKYAHAHNNLGLALQAQGDLKGAMACYQKALALDPKLAQAHYNLGKALQAKKDLPGAIASYQKVLQLDPKVASAHKYLGVALLLSGRLTEAQAALKRALELLPPSEQTAARYDAACAAVLAAAGNGEDASKLESKEQSRLRQQALAWLRDSLKQYGQQLEDADAKSRQAVKQTLQHWQKDPDLDSVRRKEALAQLPEAERTAWQEFWAEVETLLQKTQKGTK